MQLFPFFNETQTHNSSLNSVNQPHNSAKIQLWTPWLSISFNVRSYIKSHIMIYPIKCECLVKQKATVKTFKKQKSTWKTLNSFCYYVGYYSQFSKSNLTGHVSNPEIQASTIDGGTQGPFLPGTLAYGSIFSSFIFVFSFCSSTPQCVLLLRWLF